MKHRIDLLEQIGTDQDDYGSPIENWQPFVSGRWAEIDTGIGKAFSEAQQRVQEITHLITIRTIPGLDLRRLALMRIDIGDGRVLEQLIPPSDREMAQRETTIHAREILNDHDS